MRFNTLLLKLGLLAVTLAALLLSSCSSDEGIDNRDHGYGNLQFKLYKKGTTRATDELEYLRDAKKIQVNFLHDGRNFNQTLLLTFSDAESAEFGLRSEVIKLSAGDYQILSFSVYDELERILITEKLAEPIVTTVADGRLNIQDLEVAATLRGKVYFRLTKDLSGIDTTPRTRAAGDDEYREYTFDEIKYAEISLQDVNDSKHVETFPKMKCKVVMDLANGTSSVLCDTVYIPAGSYKLKSFLLRDSGERTIDYAEQFGKAPLYEIKDVTAEYLQEVAVPVKINSTAAYIKDYIALRDIWLATGGTKDPDRKHWSYVGESYPAGANWDFDKDVDLWGDQPGVSLHNNGRVAAVSLSGFDPVGEIPDAIGVLTELIEFYIGSHSDSYPDDQKPEFDGLGNPTGYRNASRTYTGKHRNNSGTEYDNWANIMQGKFTGSNRTERAYRAAQARNARKETSELFSAMRKAGQLSKSGYEDVATYADVDYGYITNHITGISPAIGNCTKLEGLFIANSHITELPDEIAELKNLTDMELYNNPLMKKFPAVLAKLPELISINMANNYQWDAKTILDGVNAMFDSGAEGPARKIQLIYLNNNNLEELPAAMKNGSALGMIDMAFNRISKLNPLTKNVKPVQFFLDNNKLEGQPFPNDGEDFCTMDDVESFSCSNNKITEFPAKLFSSKSIYVIGTVDFSANAISKIGGGDDAEWDKAGNLTKHSSFGGIKCTTLNLDDNRFKGGIPSAFATSDPISEFESLSLKVNDLDSVGWQGLKGMHSVTALDLESNRISVFSESTSFSLGIEAPFLQGINLNYNSFSEFPEWMFNGYGINQFYFEGQTDKVDGERCFKKWPDGIEQYYQLKILKMAGNDIRKVATFPSQLNYLTIDDNPNIDIVIPDDICARIVAGTFYFSYDTTQQYITGCPALGIGEDDNE